MLYIRNRRTRNIALAACLLAAAAVLGACGKPGDDRAGAGEAVVSLFNATDARDWKAVKAVFAEKVNLDYSSMTGGKPALLTPDQIIKGWSGILPGFESTHHQLGNFRVENRNGKVLVFCYGTATHYIKSAPGGSVWTVVGTYNFELKPSGSAWKITSMKFNFKYMDGNSKLPALAQKRARG